MKEIDLLIDGGSIVPMDGTGNVFKGAVAVNGHNIVGVGPSSKLSEKFKARRKIDATGKAVMPGFINMHNHLWGGLIGTLPVAEGKKIDEFLKIMWAIQEGLGSDEFYHGAALTSVANIMTGVTTLVDHLYPFVKPRAAESTIDAMEEVGIRTAFARGIMTMGYSGICEEREIAFRESERIIKKYAGNPTVQILLAPVSFRQSTPEDYQRAKEMADNYGIGVYTHVAETAQEVVAIKQQYGSEPVTLLHKLGFLGPRTVLVHCIYISDDEIEMLRASGTSTVHCPSNSMRLAKGVAPVPKMLSKGVNVTLATDTPMTAKQDMFADLYNVAILHSFQNSAPGIISPMKALEMATINGAKALGIDRQVGSLEQGKRADLILVDLTGPHIGPVYDLPRAIVFNAMASDVDTVVVDGKVVMDKRRMKTVDVKKEVAASAKVSEKFIERVRASGIAV